MAKIDTNEFPTEEQVQKFDLLFPMLDAALNEVREFSKKKQDGILNPLKVKILNRLLIEIKNEVLINDQLVNYLDFLDEETLPQNSDAVLVLGQYKAAMDQFNSKYYSYNASKGYYTWQTKK